MSSDTSDICIPTENVTEQSASDNADVSMITLQQATIKKKSIIDFTKSTFTDEEKLIISKEVELIREKYPHYIPIIVRTKDDSIVLKKRKFLVGGDITMGQFMFILRKKMDKLKPSEAIFLFVNNMVPSSSSFLSSIYASNKDLDMNMLFITVSKENTFG
jgi:GABA(A) receptor-associated protein